MAILGSNVFMLRTLLSLQGKEDESSESTTQPGLGRAQYGQYRAFWHTGLGLGKGGPWDLNGSISLTGITLKISFFTTTEKPFVWLPLKTSTTNNHYVGTQDMSQQHQAPALLLPHSFLHTCVPTWGGWAVVPGGDTAPF